MTSPLSDLIKKSEPLEAAPLHPRVLELDVDGRFGWAAVIWDALPAQELHDQLRRHVEAALLAELSRTPADLREHAPRQVEALYVIAFAEVDDAALAAFALNKTDADAHSTLAMQHIRGESQLVSREAPDEPHAIYRVAIKTTAAALSLDASMRAVSDEPFGAEPGKPFLQLAIALLGEEQEPVPNSELLTLIEARVGQAEEGVIRFIPPLVFQAFCDGVGVVASKEHGRSVQWAETSTDAQGLASPPLFRARLPTDRGTMDNVHIPIGLHLLRWCVMPLAEGETVPTVAEWALDQFGQR